MAYKIEIQHNKASLRKRLLMGSIGFTALLIVIMSYLGHGVLMELERDFERDYFSQQAPLVSSIVRTQPSLSSLLPANVIAVLDKDMPLYQRNDIDSSTVTLVSANTESFTSVNQQHYYTQYYTSNQPGEGLTIIWRTKDLTEVSAEIVNTLSIAAFITFWIAVWIALLMSAFIARRFENANQKLAQLALEDPLTKLANRNALLANNLFASSRGVLFFIDLDRFREINNALGHSMGDRMLFAFAQRLISLVDDSALVYHYRSDEFIVCMPDVRQDEVINRAFTLLYDCREPLYIGNSAFEISCSIGAASYPEQGHHPEMLIRNAENAMHRAKRLRLGVQLYNERLAYNSTIKVTLRSQLRSALTNREFILYYQPKVEISSGRLAGSEAIVRWNHPDEGLLQPGLFIDLVEQSGIIHAFTRYTLELAVQQIRQWEALGFDLPVSVNLSAYNLLDSAFIPFVKKLLDDSGIKPSLLEFELTESATMVDIAVSRRVLTNFREMGIKTSIDDFGTGMSSFAYLRELDINTVKLDQSFITSITTEPRDARIVEGIISMCHNLGIETVAEGVESQEQASLLAELDCQIAQGYFYGRPMPESEITLLLHSKNHLPGGSTMQTFIP